jgi:predicted glycosyltransferase
VVAMGGYNTFCEILSWNKPALIIPRTTPREEQLIRAQNAANLGIVCLLDPRQRINNECTIAALKSLASQAKPAELMPPNFMSGLEQVGQRFINIIRRDH